MAGVFHHLDRVTGPEITAPRFVALKMLLRIVGADLHYLIGMLNNLNLAEEDLSGLAPAFREVAQRGNGPTLPVSHCDP